MYVFEMDFILLLIIKLRYFLTYKIFRKISHFYADWLV